MADRGARAAAGDAGDRASLQLIAVGRSRTSLRVFRAGSEGSQAISKAKTSTIEYAGPRTKSNGCRSWRPNWSRRKVAVIVATGGNAVGTRGQGGDQHHPHRLHRRRGSGQARASRKPRTAGRKSTGVNFCAELGAKRLELLRELVPGSTRVACWSIRPPPRRQSRRCETWRPAAHAIGLQIEVLHAEHQPRDRGGVRNVCARAAGALLVGPALFSPAGASRLTHFAARHAIPATYCGANTPKSAG